MRLAETKNQLTLREAMVKLNGDVKRFSDFVIQQHRYWLSVDAGKNLVAFRFVFFDLYTKSKAMCWCSADGNLLQENFT